MFVCFLLAAVAAFGVATPPDAPISPLDMQRLLGKGFDTRWAEFNEDISIYTANKPRTAAKFGFANARIRVDFDLTNETFAGHLDKVIADTLDAGLIAVLAKKGSKLKKDPTNPKELEAYVAWWDAAATRYANKTHRLMFDVMVEPNDQLGKQPDPQPLNHVYQLAAVAIRASNPTRILSFAPGNASDAMFFANLTIPKIARPYAMGEWHDFAAGPKAVPCPNHYWTGNGTAAQRAAFTVIADTAANWQSSPQGAPSWFGAWAVNNARYNYTVGNQVALSSFICDTMAKRGIPWSFNTYRGLFGQNDTPIVELAPVLYTLQKC